MQLYRFDTENRSFYVTAPSLSLAKKFATEYAGKILSKEAWNDWKRYFTVRSFDLPLELLKPSLQKILMDNIFGGLITKNAKGDWALSQKFRSVFMTLVSTPIVRRRRKLKGTWSVDVGDMSPIQAFTAARKMITKAQKAAKGKKNTIIVRRDRLEAAKAKQL